MRASRRGSAWSVCLLVAVVFSAVPAPAAIQPERSPEIAALELYSSELNVRNVYQEVGQLPGSLASAAQGDLLALGLTPERARIDRRTGRWGTLLLSRPLIPGSGVGNDLRWDEAPRNDAALQARVWTAFAAFLDAHRGELRVDRSEMPNPGRVTVHEDGNVIQIYAPRVIDGIPVRDSYINAVVNHGNLVLVGVNNWGDVRSSVQPSVSPEAARRVVDEHVGDVRVRGLWRGTSLIILPLARGADSARVEPGRGLDHRLAWVVRPLLAGDQGRWEALVDAETGRLLAFQDTQHYASARLVQGGAYPVSNDGAPPDGVEVLGTPMPFDSVVTEVGTLVTDSGGNLPLAVDGNITSSLDGQYVRMADVCGAISLTSGGDLDFGGSGGDDCTTPGFGGAGNTHSSRSGFYELNRIKEQARGWLPANGWLMGTLTANMNINSSCNAFWSGSTVNFYRSGGGCGNTGELAGVFDHEWGHGMDDNDAVPSISNPGEGIADVYAGLRLDTSCIGRGFFSSNCGGYGDPCIACTGIRDIDWAKRVSGVPHDIAWIDANCGGGPAPCGGIVHCEGAVYSEAVWDTYTRTLPNQSGLDPNTALEATTRLTFLGAGGVGSWYQCSAPFGGCNGSGGYLNYLAADDDDGDLNNGTPHMTALFNAFDLHDIACNTPVVQDSGCVGTPTSAPIVTSSPADKSVALSWDPVADATEYQVFRGEGVFQCDFGKVKIGETTGTSFMDTGLQNGREYSYVVIPMGSADTCWGPASSCTVETPVSGPNLSVDPGSLVLTFNTGDGDDFIDNCESATGTFTVTNTGLGGLTNVNLESMVSTSHPLVSIDAVGMITPDILAEGESATGTFDFTAKGLAHLDTLFFEATVTATEIAGDRTGSVSTGSAESDAEFVAAITYDFEADTNGWEVISGTFDRTDASGGGANGTAFYEQSSSFLEDQCDHIRSPVVSLSPTSTLSLSTRFDIEAEFTPGVWYDRANVGLYDLGTGSRTLVTPSGGRAYNASGANGTCGTDGQGGWAGTMDSWSPSAWTSTALKSAEFSGKRIQLDVRYGTDPLEHGFGFRFDEVTLTDLALVVPDTQKNSSTLGVCVP